MNSFVEDLIRSKLGKQLGWDKPLGGEVAPWKLLRAGGERLDLLVTYLRACGHQLDGTERDELDEVLEGLHDLSVSMLEASHALEISGGHS